MGRTPVPGQPAGIPDRMHPPTKTRKAPGCLSRILKTANPPEHPCSPQALTGDPAASSGQTLIRRSCTPVRGSSLRFLFRLGVPVHIHCPRHSWVLFPDYPTPSWVLGPISRWESLKILRQTVKTGMSTKRGIRPWMWVLALSMTAVGVVGYLVGLAAISATSAPGWIAQSSVMVGLFGASFFAFLVANRRAPPLVAAILAAFVFIALVALFIVVVRTETVPN